MPRSMSLFMTIYHSDKEKKHPTSPQRSALSAITFLIYIGIKQKSNIYNIILSGISVQNDDLDWH